MLASRRVVIFVRSGENPVGVFTKKGDAAVLAKLADAPAPYRDIGERIHRIIRESAPSLEPIVRWGLPFYTKHGKDVCYLKPDKDFIAFGFAEVANPSQEEGAHMHPVAWTVTSLDASTEDRIRELVRKAAK
jgi:hypothetical protein